VYENDPDNRISWSAEACAGTSVGGYCYYLSALGDSCTNTCASAGGVHRATFTVIGKNAFGLTSSSALAVCDSVLDTLIGPVNTSTVTGRNGTGCYYYQGGSTGGYDDDLPTNAWATYLSSQRVCACQN
jgi:hypothetical protein